VTQAIGRLKRKGQPELERLKRRLEQVYENHNGEVEARICERMSVSSAKHHQYRQRGGNLIYDDAYGVVTDADLIASAEEAFLTYDKEEAEHAQHRAR